jgi:hypothetical protein
VIALAAVVALAATVAIWRALRRASRHVDALRWEESTRSTRADYTATGWLAIDHAEAAIRAAYRTLAASPALCELLDQAQDGDQ